MQCLNQDLNRYRLIDLLSEDHLPKDAGDFRLLDRKFKPKIKYYLDKKIKKYPHRDFVDVKDLGNLIVKIIKKLKIVKINNTFNVGSGKSISIFKLYGKFKKFKKISKPIFKLLKKEELLKTQANISKTKRYFRWKESKW